MAFADQVYRHVLKKGGGLTVPKALKRFRARMAEVDAAISCEAARWGATCATKPDHEQWLTNCLSSVSFIEKRTPYFLKAYRDRKWYPSIDAPTLSKDGEEMVDGDGVKRGDVLTLAVPDGTTVYYTLDGSDPRRRGGELDPSASVYDAEEGLVVGLGGSFCVNARACSAKGEWSALESVRLSQPSGTMLLFR